MQNWIKELSRPVTGICICLLSSKKHHFNPITYGGSDLKYIFVIQFVIHFKFIKYIKITFVKFTVALMFLLIKIVRENVIPLVRL